MKRVTLIFPDTLPDISTQVMTTIIDLARYHVVIKSTTPILAGAVITRYKLSSRDVGGYVFVDIASTNLIGNTVHKTIPDALIFARELVETSNKRLMSEGSLDSRYELMAYRY